MPSQLSRRSALGGIAALVAGLAVRDAAAADPEAIRFALTPVLLTTDLVLLDDLRAYLEAGTGRAVQLVTRRTYQEITALAVSGQVDGAWICGFPFVQQQHRLDLLAVPVWRGKPLYQSYLICDVNRPASGIFELRNDIHAFSDPDSNSGFLVTAAELASQGQMPEPFFRKTIYTYGHFNVVRAVASGLANSGSVDGYVYDVLRESNPELTGRTRIVRASSWYGFPPVACQLSLARAEKSELLRRTLLSMHKVPTGQALLKKLRLDRFESQPAELFASIQANWDLVRSVG